MGKILPPDAGELASFSLLTAANVHDEEPMKALDGAFLTWFQFSQPLAN